MCIRDRDKPTVTINIPIEKLSMEEDTLQSHTSAIAAADHCLRKFAPYIDGLNAELYNRSRPDSENGKDVYKRQEPIRHSAI